MNVERILQRINANSDPRGVIAFAVAGVIHGYVVAVEVYCFNWPGTGEWRVRQDGSAEAARRGVDG